MDDLMVARNRDELSFEEMRHEEQMIVRALEEAQGLGHDMLHITDLQDVNGWDGPQGNSKVRNNLRRLMRYGWIHRVLDGTYALTYEPVVVESQPEPVEEPLQPVVQFVPEPVVQLAPELQPPVVVRPGPPLVQIRKKNRMPHPVELDADERLRIRARAMRDDFSGVDAVKHPDCTFYNACIDQAIAGSWAGFSCAECHAYKLPDRHQAEMDILASLALNKAREMMEKFGKVLRVRGVKPGADAKRSTDEDADDFDASACAVAV